MGGIKMLFGNRKRIKKLEEDVAMLTQAHSTLRVRVDELEGRIAHVKRDDQFTTAVVVDEWLNGKREE